jgi:ubiquinone/menaquinone biosynthesis C-methylase UbiE
MEWKLKEKNWHNLIASTYDSTTLKEYRYFHPLLKRYLKNLKLRSAKLILDCGCGTGRATFLAHNLGFNVFCMDISTEMLKRIGDKKISNKSYRDMKIVLIVGDAEYLPFKDGCFDAVISAGLLHHLPNIAQALSEQIRVSKDKNLFIGEPTDQTALIWKKLENLIWKLYWLANRILKRINLSLPPLAKTSPAEHPVSGNDIECLLKGFGLKYEIKYFLHSPIIDTLLPPFLSRCISRVCNLIHSGKQGNFFIIKTNYP